MIHHLLYVISTVLRYIRLGVSFAHLLCLLLMGYFSNNPTMYWNGAVVKEFSMSQVQI